MERKSSLRSLLEFYQARLIALDNWNLVKEAMTISDFPVRTLVQTLGVTELGAHSVIAMYRSGPLPERSQIEHRLQELEQIRYTVVDTGVRRRLTIARTGARHMLA